MIEASSTCLSFEWLCYNTITFCNIEPPICLNDTSLMAEAETQWMNAVIKDDGELVQDILSDPSSSKSDIPLATLFQQTRILTHIRLQCVMTSSPFVPDNAVCLAALLNSKNVLQVMLEFGVLFTQQNSHTNTFVHCMIAYASTQSEDHEAQYTKTIAWIRSSISSDDFRSILLTENSDGLRPLELAAHLGTFILFTCLFETEGIYLSKIQEVNLYTVQYYDITEYVIGDRYYTSPAHTITVLDRCKLDQKSTRDIFNNNPMATWFSAVIRANTPFIFIYAFLRITAIVNFFASMVLTKRMDDNTLPRNTTGDVMDKYCNSTIIQNPALPILAFYNSVVCVMVLVFDTVGVLLYVSDYDKVKWSHKLVSRRKDTVCNTGLVNIASWASWIGILAMSIDILKQHLTDKGIVCFSSNSADIMVLLGVLASIWDILFFMQFVPGLNLYVIAVQQILKDFMSFSIILAFFFFSYSIGFYLLAKNPFDFGSSIYETFRLMLNMIDFSDLDNALQIFHVAFIFLIVYICCWICSLLYSSHRSST